jgi:nucleoside-diphosphate-sugar epimerase
MSKLAMEHMARTYLDRLPVVFTRPFNYTGPGQAPDFLIPKLVSHFALFASAIDLGNLHTEREFNDVRMVCDAYLALLDHGVLGEVYNVCSGQPYTLQTVLDELTKITGHELVVRVNPAFVRANEVHRLCGDPAKLLACVGPLRRPALRETLQTMLQACK